MKKGSIVRSLRIDTGNKIFFHSGETAFLGRGGNTTFIPDTTPCLDAIAEIKAQLPLVAIHNFDNISTDGSNIRAIVRPDIYLGMLPINSQHEQQNMAISARHLLMHWKDDNLLLTDAGSNPIGGTYMGNTRIEQNFKISDEMKIVFGRVLWVKFHVVKRNRSIAGIIMERTRNFPGYRYVFLKNRMTVGSGDHVDIKLDGPGPDTWGEVYRRENWIGIQPVEGAPTLLLNGTREILPSEFVCFTLGATLSWENGPTVRVDDNWPLDEVNYQQEPVRIIDLGSGGGIGGTDLLKMATRAAEEDYNLEPLYSFLEDFKDVPEQSRKALHILQRVIDKHPGDYFGQLSVIRGKVPVIENLVKSMHAKVASSAADCYKIIQSYIRSMEGPKLYISLVSSEPIIKDEYFNPSILISNFGEFPARNVRLVTLDGGKCEFDEDLFNDDLCYQVNANETKKSRVLLNGLFPKAGKRIILKAKLQYLDHVDDTLQETEIKIAVCVERDVPGDAKPVIYHIYGDYYGDGTIRIGDHANLDTAVLKTYHENKPGAKKKFLTETSLSEEERNELIREVEDDEPDTCSPQGGDVKVGSVSGGIRGSKIEADGSVEMGEVTRIEDSEVEAGGDIEIDMINKVNYSNLKAGKKKDR